METKKMGEREIVIAIRAAVEAGERIREIYEQPDILEVNMKEDASPITQADLLSNTVINEALEATGIPIISEENNQVSYEQRRSWPACWIVDPLDGTKEFVKGNSEFTVNIAYCEYGKSIFGVIYVPVTRILYYGDTRTSKSYKVQISKDLELPESLFKPAYEIRPSAKSKTRIRVVGSRNFLNADTSSYIENLKGQYEEVEFASIGSSLKFCLLAEGEADAYPRFGPTMEWDTAAGSAIAEAVGLQVIAQPSHDPLRYNKEDLLNPNFLVIK